MDSPPSYSLSVTGPLSDIGSSGIGGSISSDSVRAHFATTEQQESDMESKSLSQDSFDYSDGMHGENFNTLKKGPNAWTDVLTQAATKVAEQRKLEVEEIAIKPPPEFQDSPSPPDTSASSLEPLSSEAHTVLQAKKRVANSYIHEFAEHLVETIVEEALEISCKISWPDGKIILKPLKQTTNTEVIHSCSRTNKSARIWASDYLTSSSPGLATANYQGTITITPFSTLNRPNSRSSLASSRLSSSHNSINTLGLSNKADDSSFITSAMSHDILTVSQISDMYNVPFDSDIYTMPIDMVRPLHHELRTPQRPKRHKHHRKRRRNASACSQSEFEFHIPQRHYCGSMLKPRTINYVKSQKMLDMCCNDTASSMSATMNGTCGTTGKRHSVPGTSAAAAAATVCGRHNQHLQQQHHQNCRQLAKFSNNPVRNMVGEPIHMTLHEVRQYLQTLYSSGSSENCGDAKMKREKMAKMLPHSAGQSSIHLTTMPKLLHLNNNNKYSNPVTDTSTTNTPLSNKSSNGLLQLNNNNINNNNNNNNGSSTAKKLKKNTLSTLKYKRNKDETLQRGDESRTLDGTDGINGSSNKEKMKKSQRNFSLNLKQTLCNIFRFKKISSPEHQIASKRNNTLHHQHSVSDSIVQDDDDLVVDYDQHPSHQINNNNGTSLNGDIDDAEMVTTANGTTTQKLPFFKRALPPLPKANGYAENGIDSHGEAVLSNGGAPMGCESPGNTAQQQIRSQQQASALENDDEQPAIEDTSMDFAASIEKVKDYGWYWGPISGEAAEKILSNEPDGSFIVRDSSDDHYIFSLSFRLNSCVRHVRIEHDQGNFSFGSCTKFKSHTIVDFIENAVEHSRSGRYLFFLHRRPVLGPMRVQLLHPVSRFKQVQSLQHTCRFVILKMVRKDLIPTLPLPRRLIDYLSAPHYYSEQLACEHEQEERVESPVSSSTGELEKICFTPQGLS